MKKIILCIFFLVSFYANAQLLIDEYSGANYDSHQDNYGEYEDWLEIYNPTITAIDLNGWYLSDKTNNPAKWVFPSSFDIPAGGVAIVYCSGRDEITFRIRASSGPSPIISSLASGTVDRTFLTTLITRSTCL